MGKWFQKWSAFDSARSLGEWVAWGLLGLCGTSLATLMATAAAYTQWYWDAYGPIGVAFAFIVSLVSLAICALATGGGILLAAMAKAALSKPQNKELSNEGAHLRLGPLETDIEALKGIAQLHLEKFDAKSEEFDSKLVAYAQGMRGLSERISGIDQMLKPSRQLTILESLGAVLKPATNRFESIENKIANVEGQIGSFASPLKESLQRIEERLTRLNADTADTFEKVRQVFHSERVLEACKDRTKEIEETAARLDDPLSKPELYGEWSNWEQDFHQFKSQLSILDRFVKANVDIAFDFFDTPNERYASSNWSYNFKDMTDDQKLNYKTYRIMLGNYWKAREHIFSKVYNGTFLIL